MTRGRQIYANPFCQAEITKERIIPIYPWIKNASRLRQFLTRVMSQPYELENYIKLKEKVKTFTIFILNFRRVKIF